MKPTKYSILPQSNTRARVRIASCLWLGILHCLALVIWHQSTEPKALSNSLSGPAWIRDIEPCQGVLPGNGHVITATFQHSSGDVIDLVWSDDGSRNLESIGTTSNHPFYSFDRGDYVQAGSLQEGERLLTYSGDTKRVVSKLARPGPETVYNLEVFGEHVYFIGHDGVLVHNSDSYGLNAGAPKETVTVFRVQGGKSLSGAPGSRQLIDVDEFGDVALKQTTLNVSIGDASHAKYFQTLRPGSKITSFEIPKWMDDFIRAEAIPQKGYRTNPLNQGGLAPKIVDPHQPGFSVELPSIWAEWLQETAIKGSGRLR